MAILSDTTVPTFLRVFMMTGLFVIRTDMSVTLIGYVPIPGIYERCDVPHLLALQCSVLVLTINLAACGRARQSSVLEIEFRRPDSYGGIFHRRGL